MRLSSLSKTCGKTDPRAWAGGPDVRSEALTSSSLHFANSLVCCSLHLARSVEPCLPWGCTQIRISSKAPLCKIPALEPRVGAGVGGWQM